MTAYNDIAPIPKQMTIVVGLCVVGLMAFGLALSYYKNVLFDKQLLEMQARNNRLHSDVLQGYAELRYLESSQYKDKYAKENFGLLRSGEKVLFLNTNDEPLLYAKTNDLTPDEKEAIYEENLRNIRVIDHWKIYLFDRQNIEELKKQI